MWRNPCFWSLPTVTTVHRAERAAWPAQGLSPPLPENTSLKRSHLRFWVVFLLELGPSEQEMKEDAQISGCGRQEFLEHHDWGGAEGLGGLKLWGRGEGLLEGRTWWIGPARGSLWPWWSPGPISLNHLLQIVAAQDPWKREMSLKLDSLNEWVGCENPKS